MVTTMTLTWERAGNPAELGRHFADLRVQRGMTQTQVADALGISRRYVCEIEAGKPSLYSKRLVLLLDLLDAGLVLEGEDVA